MSGVAKLCEDVASREHIKTLSGLIADCLKSSLSLHRVLVVDLIAHWRDIVGSSSALLAQPKRLYYPRSFQSSLGEKRRFRAGTLELSCSANTVLTLQYEIPRIIERVNAYLGYEAVAHIKIVQKQICFSGAARCISSDLVAGIDERSRLHLKRLLSGLSGDRGLQLALEDLGRSVLSKNKSLSE